MMRCTLIVATTFFIQLSITCVALQKAEQTLSWPRARSLLAFWPLDDDSRLANVAGTGKQPRDALIMGQISQNKLKGPFGKLKTSMSSRNSNDSSSQSISSTNGILRDSQPLTKSFTISMFVFLAPSSPSRNGNQSSFLRLGSKNGRRGLFVFSDSTEQAGLFSATYNPPSDIELWSNLNGDSSSPIAKLPIARAGQWNFLAVTYDVYSEVLSVHYQNSESGHLKVTAVQSTVLPVDPQAILRIGVGSSSSSNSNRDVAAPGDAFACAMLYNTSLEAYEIAQLPSVCETKGQNRFKDLLPRPRALVAFMPLDKEGGLDDAAFYISSNGGGATLNLKFPGPFGAPNGSYTNGASDRLLEYYQLASVSNMSFTISMFIHTNGRGNGSAFMLAGVTKSGFLINYAEPNLVEVVLIANSTSLLLARLPILEPNKWNFLAFTFDPNAQMLDVYKGDQDGANLVNTIPIQGADAIPTILFLGYSSSTAAGLRFMQPGDAISCFMYYQTPLSWCEIAELPKVCHDRHMRSPSYEASINCPVVLSKSWPRPTSIVGFWPLDANSGTTDLATRRRVVPPDAFTFSSSRLGPFGVSRTSSYYLSTKPNVAMAKYSPIALTADFTLSLYFYEADLSAGAILSFWNPETSQFGFGLAANEGYLEIWTGYNGSTRVGDFLVPLNVSSWNFIALSYTKQAQVLRLFDEDGSTVAAIPLVDIASNPSTSLYFGSLPFGYSSMQPNSSLACVALYSTDLEPVEIADLPYACRTRSKGLRLRSGTVGDYTLSYADVLAHPPNSLFNLAKKLSFTFDGANNAASLFNTFNNVNLITGQLTQPRSSLSCGALQTKNTIPVSAAGNWRLEVQFAATPHDSTESKFAVLISSVDSIAPQAESFCKANKDKLLAISSQTALLVAQILPPINGLRMPYIGFIDGSSSTISGGRLATEVSGRSCDPRCSFTNYDLSSGIRMVLQAIDDRLTVAMYSRYHKLPAVCFENLPVDGLSSFIGNKTAAVAIAASNIAPGSSRNGSHDIFVREIKFYDIKRQGKVPDSEHAEHTHDEASLDVVPIPHWSLYKHAHLQCRHTFTLFNQSSFAQNFFYTSLPLFHEEDYSMILLSPDDDNETVKWIWTRKALPIAATNWRIELKFTATIPPIQDEALWSFTLMIVNSSQMLFDDYLGIIGSPPGLYLTQLVRDPWQLQLSTRFAGNFTPCDQRCTLRASDLESEATIIIQSIGDLVSVYLAPYGRAAPITCYSYLDMTGIASMIAQGSAVLAASVQTVGALPTEDRIGVPTIKINQLLFFSLTNANDTTIDTCIFPPTTKRPPLPGAPSNEHQYYSIENLIPEMPKEKTKPLQTTDLVKICDDFAAYRVAPPNEGKPTKVFVAFLVNTLLGINNVEESIAVDSVLYMAWNVTTCPRRSVDAFSSRSDEALHVASLKDTWVPAVRFTSSATTNTYMLGDKFADDLTVILRKLNKDDVNPNGNRTFDFYFTREGLYSSRCSLDLSRFPYDVQTCTFVFEFQRSEDVVQFRDDPVFSWPEDYTPEWRRVDSMAKVSKRKFKGLYMRRVEFTVVLARIPDYYIANLALPSFMLALLNLATFLMPPEQTDRPIFAVTTLLALTVAQSDILRELPKTSERVMLGDYAKLLSWFGSIVTVFHLFANWCTGSFRNEMARGAGGIYKQRICQIRVIDLYAFLSALFFFIAVHIFYAVLINDS